MPSVLPLNKYNEKSIAPAAVIRKIEDDYRNDEPRETSSQLLFPVCP